MDNQLMFIAVVGFHHSKGYQIEFCYPPCDEDDSAWTSSYLASLGLPDGAHNFSSDTVFFRFKNAADNLVWGVCSYKQVDSASYKEVDPEVTRSAIQKSICIVAKGNSTEDVPWRTIAAKLEPIAHAYIQHQDTSVLQGFFDRIKPVVETPCSELLLEVRSVLLKYDVHLITLMKLRLLQKRVLFLSSDQPTHIMCSEILALESAVPFGPIFYPYITLSMMDDPVITNASGFIGASNRLYKQKWKDHCDVLVENGSLTFADKTLEKVLNLTQADLRFADWLTKKCKESACRWEGSEEWIRMEISNYFWGLRYAVKLKDFESGEKLRSAYGINFVSEICKLDEVVKWLDTCEKSEKEKSSGDTSETATHPGAGHLSLQDVKLRFFHHARDLMSHFNNL